MKKKIVALTLVVAMLAIAIVGGTLAYFTDVDQATNAYGVAGLDISLSETVDHVDGVGNLKAMVDGNAEVTGPVTGNGIAYQHIMPGDVMTKVVTVANEEDYPAYVALAIKQENWKAFNLNVDDYFEGKGYDAAQMQAVTDDIFSGTGWNGLVYDKTAGNDVRYYPTVTVDAQDGLKSYVGNDSTEPILIAVDYTVQQGAGNVGYAAGYKDNMFGEQFQDGAYTLSRCTGGEMYGSLNATNERMWVYYLYLPAHTSYTLDLTVTCPTYMVLENIEAFENMVIDVRATAIQVDGFATAKDAFTELNNTYDFGF